MLPDLERSIVEGALNYKIVYDYIMRKGTNEELKKVMRRSSMQLIKTEPSHIEELVRISKEAFDSDVSVGATGPGGPPDYDSKEWHLEMMKENHLYTAMDRGKIVGGAIIFENPKDNKVLYIGRIFVDPDCFRQGYGMGIMALIEKLYSNTSTLRLDTPIWNVRTNRFYKKLGYKEMSRDEEFIYYEKKLI